MGRGREKDWQREKRGKRQHTPNSILPFSLSFTTIASPFILSRLRFSLVIAHAYNTHATPLKHKNDIQTAYPFLYRGASAGKIENVAIIPPIFPTPTCHAVPTALL
jgi:hypothetical protein